MLNNMLYKITHCLTGLLAESESVLALTRAPARIDIRLLIYNLKYPKSVSCILL